MKTPQQIADSVVRKTAGIIPDDLAKSYFFSNPYGLDFHTWAGMQDTNQGEDIPTEAMPEVEGEEPPYDAETEAEYMPNAPDTPDVGTEPAVSPVAPVPLPAGKHKKTAALLQMVATKELVRRGIIKVSKEETSDKPAVRLAVEDFLRRNAKLGEDQIPGGLAQGKKDSDFSASQIAMGEKVEKEHTPDPAKAREIARDHLDEFPDYYTALKAMEKHLEEKKTASLYVSGRAKALSKFGLDAAALLGQDEQRKDDLHQQTIRHNEENHQVDLAKGQLELQQAQETFGMKQQQQAQKNQEQQAQQQMMQQQQAQQQQAQSQQWRANMAGGGEGQQPPQQGMQAPR